MRIRKVKLTIAGETVAVTGLYHHSQQVKAGGLFFALKDGTYINEAIQNGAIVTLLLVMCVKRWRWSPKLFTAMLSIKCELLA